MNRPPAELEEERLLVIAAQHGDVAAFNQLVERYQRQVYGLCRYMLDDPEAAQDAAQDAFMLAYRGLPRFKGGQFRSWMLRITANVCRDALRVRKRRPTLSLDLGSHADPDQPVLDPPAPDQPLDDRLLRHELSALITECMAQLPEPQRIVLVLSDIEGLPYDEIAQITQMNLGTVKSRISRARAHLRDLLRASDLLPQRYVQPLTPLSVSVG